MGERRRLKLRPPACPLAVEGRQIRIMILRIAGEPDVPVFIEHLPERAPGFTLVVEATGPAHFARPAGGLLGFHIDHAADGVLPVQGRAGPINHLNLVRIADAKIASEWKSFAARRIDPHPVDQHNDFIVAGNAAHRHLGPHLAKEKRRSLHAR